MTRLAAIAAISCLALAIGGSSAATAGSGSGLKLPGKPGLFYEFNERSSRGVTIVDDASLELRFDGCWKSSTDIRNDSDHPRRVSISIQFLDEDGRPLDAVPVVTRQTIEPLSETTIERANCSAALAASYSLQRCWHVRRLVSTH